MPRAVWTIACMTNDYDVIVIGGGSAGLSGALMLGRSRRSVLVLDDGRYRNAPAAHMHGYLTRDGIPPAEFREVARREVRGYGVEILDACAISATSSDVGVTVTLEGGRTVSARRLLVAAGLTDVLPDIPGLAERFGRDAVHCPFCHGWEVRDEPIGVLTSGPKAVHQALMFRQLSPHITLLQHTGPALTDEQQAELAALDIPVVSGEVRSLRIENDRLTGVVLETGEVVSLHVLVVGTQVVARSAVLTSLGLEPVPHPMGRAVGELIPADATGRTAVSNVWVAGNVTDLYAQVISAAAQGAMAGAAISGDLVAEDARRAVEQRRLVSRN